VGWGPGKTPPPVSGAVPAVSLSDIAGFRPVAGVTAMEPSGWAVVGLETNFFVTGGESIAEGMLLGQPARVHFTPVTWRWDYGDGDTTVAQTPGASWETLRAEEFEKTPSSHAYETRGQYVITTIVDYTAEYSLAGSGWTPITGTVPVPTNDVTAIAGHIRTALVAHDCTTNPHGTGCH
jgi:hypothetical protein